MLNNSNKIPIWFMRQAGRYLPEYHVTFGKGDGFLDVCYNENLALEITMQPIKRFDFDAAIVFCDILLLPHAIGCDISFIKNVGPLIKPLTNELDKINYVELEKKISPVLNLLKNIRNKLDNKKSLIGFAGSPWTVLAYLIEGGSSKNFAKVREFVCRNEERFNYLINKITEATIFYLAKQIENGADIIQLFDSWAGVLSAEQFQKWVIKPTKKIVSSLNKAKIIGFPKGAGCLYLNYVEETGVDIVSVDYTVPINWIRDNLQPISIVQGNLDPFLLAYNKKKALVQTEEILSTLGNKKFIFNLGHGILKETPIENVESVVQKVRCLNKM